MVYSDPKIEYWSFLRSLSLLQFVPVLSCHTMRAESIQDCHIIIFQLDCNISWIYFKEKGYLASFPGLHTQLFVLQATKTERGKSWVWEKLGMEAWERG